MAKLEQTLSGDFDSILRRIEDGILHRSLSAITSGGSQAVFFKINTWGKEAFLDKLRELI